MSLHTWHLGVEPMPFVRAKNVQTLIEFICKEHGVSSTFTCPGFRLFKDILTFGSV